MGVVEDTRVGLASVEEALDGKVEDRDASIVAAAILLLGSELIRVLDAIERRLDENGDCLSHIEDRLKELKDRIS